MRIKLSHSFCLFHESQGSSFLVAAHSIVPLPLWLAHLGPWHRGAAVGTRPIPSKSQQGVGGHSQWWPWEPILVMPGVVSFSILESAPTAILSQGNVYPGPVASYSSLVLLSARWGDQHSPPSCTELLEDVRSQLDYLLSESSHLSGSDSSSPTLL